MAALAVRLISGALRELRALPEPIRHRIRLVLRDLGDVPRPPGANLVSGNRPERIWRVRVGEYRVLYQIRDEEQIVVVIRIGHRRDV